MSIKKPEWNFNNSYSKLPPNFFTRILPEPVSNPQILFVNYVLAQELGLNLADLSVDELSQLFSGNTLPKGAEPISQAYAGHQFGQFTYLGDGRAHLIGELIKPDGGRVDIQLKGSGKTPYSRRGDGRAALEPMLREYLISEAMHALHVPTTRSLAVVTTGEPVYRETVLQGAILTRIASSHIRIGTFVYLSAKNDTSGLTTLADYVIARHYAELQQSSEPYLDLLKSVMNKQAELITNWIRIGFIHGVMNTDNVAISGETIDYGPCAFMDAYDPQTVFSSIDTLGRYSFGNQPIITQWNLARFAEALLPLLHKNPANAIRIAEETIHTFSSIFEEKWLAMMRCKLGLFGEQLDDHKLCLDLLNWMMQESADYTNTFRDLSLDVKPNTETYESNTFQNWYVQWQHRLKQNAKPMKSSREVMHANNPVVIPRNHTVNKSLTAASNGELQLFKELLHVLESPYKNSKEKTPYQFPPTRAEQVFQTFCGT